MRNLPQANQVLCRWYINKIILKNCKQIFSHADEWNALMVACRACVMHSWRWFWRCVGGLVRWVWTRSGSNFLLEKYLDTTQREVCPGVGEPIVTSCVLLNLVSWVDSCLFKAIYVIVRKWFACYGWRNKSGSRTSAEGVAKTVACEKIRGLHLPPLFCTQLRFAKFLDLHCQRSTNMPKNQWEECTGRFTVTMGLPCRHLMHQKSIVNQMLFMSAFNCHWWLDDFLAFSSTIDVVNHMPSRFEDKERELRNKFKIHVKTPLNRNDVCNFAPNLQLGLTELAQKCPNGNSQSCPPPA